MKILAMADTHGDIEFIDGIAPSLLYVNEA